MENWLKNFDRVSFWLGFLAATLVWFLLSRLFPWLKQFFAGMKVQRQTTQHQRSLGDEVRFGNDVLRLAEGMHLAAPLFSLDEIILPPRLLAPAVPPMAYEPAASEDITDWAVPHLPDWPELGSYYGAPWLTLAEALRNGANLVITGQPGVGKSVMLADLACRLARREPEVEHLAELTPLLIHAADLVLPPLKPEEPLGPLLGAVSRYATSIPAKRLPTVLQNLLKQGRILLLVDGLDELPSAPLVEITGYLGQLLQLHPELRLVVTAAPDNLDGLSALGLRALPVAVWNQAQRAVFITRWSEQWMQFVADPRSKGQSADPMLLVGWLLNNTANLTPLELTLKVWAAFAGDSIGPGTLAAMEAYLRRMLAGQPARNRPAFQQLAVQMVLSQQPFASQKDAERWLGGDVAPTAAPEAAASEAPQPGKTEVVRARGALPDLLERGLLVAHAGERISIVHPALAGYLAAQALAAQQNGAVLAAQPAWSGRSAALGPLAVLESQPAWMGSLLQDEEFDPVLSGLLAAGRWLRGAPENQPWVAALMRRLTSGLQKDKFPFGLRARLLSALLLSGNSGLPVLLRMMLDAPQPELRRLAVLGLGFLRDAKNVVEIGRLVQDPHPEVSRSAILALSAIGDKNGLEAVAFALLNGDDTLRRAAAEGLANNLEDGHPTLEEASGVEDAAVRRAAVFGLVRIRQPWAIRIVERLHAEDQQWVVQDAANQAIQLVSQHNPRIPQTLPVLSQSAWLIAFAAERGMGVAPGKPAYEMLGRALKEGSEDQQLAAVYFLTHRPSEDVIIPLYQLYYTSSGEVHENCFEALNQLAASGTPLPSPTQYGMK